MGPLFESVPLEQRTLVTLVERAAREHGDRTFLEIAGGSLLFGELPLAAGRVAAGLSALGVRRGERVALIVSNRIEWAMAYLGCAWMGAVLVPLAPDLRERLLSARLEHCQPAVIIAEAEAVEAAIALSASLSELRGVVALDGPPTSGQVTNWAELVDREPIAPASLSFDDVSMIAYTSGTTGPSKGVVVRHHQIYCSTVPLTENLRFGPDDVLWTCLPLSHAGAHHHVFVPALISGARAVVRPRFSATTFWEDIRGSGATYAQVIGMIANVLLDAPPHDLDGHHGLRVMTSFPPPADPAAFARRFGIEPNWQMWGMTEVYGNPPRLEPQPKAPNCVGRPAEFFEVRVVDGAGKSVPRDGTTPGEAVVRPRLPHAMVSDYYRDPAGTRERIRDGWFHTGDLMTWDEDGYLYFAGRSKDMIRRRGENVSAYELEAEVLRLQGIAQAAAYGVPSDLSDEDIKLDVVLAPGARQPTAREVVDRLRGSLPPFMLPRYVQFRSELPTTPAGKVEKYKLAAEGITADATDVLGPGGRSAR